MSRRLDVLFAERVLGKKAEFTNAYSTPEEWWESDEASSDPLREYTTNLSAAWGGVEKLGRCEERCDAMIRVGVQLLTQPVGSPAMAVVLACLRAVGVSEEEIAAAREGISDGGSNAI